MGQERPQRHRDHLKGADGLELGSILVKLEGEGNIRDWVGGSADKYRISSHSCPVAILVSIICSSCVPPQLLIVM